MSSSNRQVADLLRRRQGRGFHRGFGPERRFLLALGENKRIAFDRDLADLVHHRAGTSRNEAANDDVLLKAIERIGLAVNRGLRQHPGRFLERRRGDERPRLQRGLGDAQQHRMRDRRLLAFRRETGVDLIELGLVDLLALDQVGLARVVDLHLLQHLPHDHFDVLVVDGNALEPVDVLDLVDEVARELLDALDRQNVVRRRIAFDDVVAFLDEIAVLQVDVFALGDEILPYLLVLAGRLDRDTPLVLVIAAETDRSGNFGDDRGFLGTAGLEQLGDTRQTAGDVARLGALGRDTGDDVARTHFGAGIDRDDGIDRQQRTGITAAAELENLAILAFDDQRRAQILLAASRTRAPIDHNALGDTGRFVERFGQRLAFDQVLVADRTLDLGQDRTGVRIPLRNALAALDVIAVINLQPRAVSDTVHGAFGAVRIGDGNDQVAAHRDQIAVRILGDVFVLDLDGAVEVRLDERLLRNLRSAANVERAHGELSAGLADRLRGDDANRFAHIDGRAAGKIAPVAGAATAARGFAGKNRTDLQLLHAGVDQLLHMLLLEQRRVRHQNLVTGRIAHVLGRGAAEDTACQRRHDCAGVDDRPNLDAPRRAAVKVGDDAILRHIDETPRQIAGVRGFQRGVGETLAGAVRRVEVLEHREAFFEVRDDRALDDFARRLGHEAAHAGELTHLRRRAARAGMRHHEDRVDLTLLAFLRRGPRRRDFLHHRFCDGFGALRPGVDDLVVLLALGDQAVVVLLLEFLHQIAGLFDGRTLGMRHHHVVLAERDAGLEGVMEAECHDAVAEDHRLLLTAVAIHRVDHPRDFALRHELVDEVERGFHLLWQYFAEDDAARRRLVPARDRFAVLAEAVPTIFDLAVQADGLLVQSKVDLGQVAEQLELLVRAAFAHDRQVVEAEHDILRRHDDRRAVRGMQDVVGRHHQDARFELRLERQRHVDRHLVAVEIGIERRADQRMKLDRLAFDQHRLESLDAETMQGRRAVEQHRMLADHLVEDIPNLGLFLLDELLGLLHRSRQTLGVEPRIDERLEQFERHLLRQSALMQLELGTDHDHGAAGIIDALAEQVLPETALLSLEHVGERLQRPLVGTGDDSAAAAVVEQGVDRLLQHPLLVADDDVGSAQLDEPL